MLEVLRYDQLNINELKLKKTPEGYLEGFAVATRVGVFPYRRADGSVQREFRPAEEVFNEDSLNSFKMLPITDNHPDVMVTADNAKEFSIGFTGQEIKKIDDKYMAPYVKITDKKAVEAAQQGLKKGLSWGYKVDLVKKDGIYNGERYDYVQTNIRGNHLAIVYQGRAGEQAALRVDSEDAFCVFNNNFNNDSDNMKVKKIRLDEKEFEVAEEVAAKLDSSAAEISSLKDTNKNQKNKIDSLEGERDALKSKLDAESKKDNSDEIAKQVQVRVNLIKKAGEFFKADEDLTSLSEKEIHMKAILAVQPDSKFDGKSDEYIAARFDTICEFRKDKNIAKSFEIASEKKDTDSTAQIAVSNEALQADLINRSKSKGE